MSMLWLVYLNERLKLKLSNINLSQQSWETLMPNNLYYARVDLVILMPNLLNYARVDRGNVKTIYF